MGKRKEAETEEEISVGSIEETVACVEVSTSRKKHHKKHKHKKHKKTKKNDSEDDIDIGMVDSPSDDKLQAVKVKIKFPNQAEKKTSPPKQATQKPTILDPSDIQTFLATDTSSNSSKSPSKSTKKKNKKDEKESSEEERWLDAIESGKLEEIDDELRKIKDPKLMTARQRAMFVKKITDKEGNSSIPEDAPLMSLPTGYKEKEMTEEMIKKRAIKSEKRRQLAEEKKEKDKKKTMERLLRKQESKAAKAFKPKVVSRQDPKISKVITKNLVTVAFPIGMEFPFNDKKALVPPPKKYCSIQGCKNLRRYCCSTTGVPLCSLECYKKNMIKWNFGRNS